MNNLIVDAMQCQFNVPLFGINEKERLEIFQSGKHQRIIIVTKIASHDNTRTRLRYGIIKLVCYLLPLLSVRLLLKYVSGTFTTRSQQSPTDHQKRVKKKKSERGLESSQKWAGRAGGRWCMEDDLMSNIWHGFAFSCSNGETLPF